MRCGRPKRSLSAWLEPESGRARSGAAKGCNEYAGEGEHDPAEMRAEKDGGDSGFSIVEPVAQECLSVDEEDGGEGKRPAGCGSGEIAEGPEDGGQKQNRRIIALVEGQQSKDEQRGCCEEPTVEGLLWETLPREPEPEAEQRHCDEAGECTGYRAAVGDAVEDGLKVDAVEACEVLRGEVGDASLGEDVVEVVVETGAPCGAYLEEAVQGYSSDKGAGRKGDSEGTPGADDQKPGKNKQTD